MRKALAIVAVVALSASVASAGPMMVSSWVCDRDNSNDSSSPLLNYGRKCNARWAKDKQETTHYADWSEEQLMEIEVALAGPPPDPYDAWEVRYAFTGVTWEGPNPANVVWFGAFQSGVDWVNDEACDNAGPFAGVGACHLYSNDAGGAAVPWTLPGGGGPVANFWALPELTNSVPFVGYVPSTGPGDAYLMRVPVDPPVLNLLINDPDTRGLRCWSDQWNNHQVYYRGQWGCPGVAARLELWAVPEPATLLLIGLGGVGLVLRKRR
jgi:hypothetical protein